MDDVLWIKSFESMQPVVVWEVEGLSPINLWSSEVEWREVINAK